MWHSSMSTPIYFHLYIAFVYIWQKMIFLFKNNIYMFLFEDDFFAFILLFF